MITPELDAYIRKTLDRYEFKALDIHSFFRDEYTKRLVTLFGISREMALDYVEEFLYKKYLEGMSPIIDILNECVLLKTDNAYVFIRDGSFLTPDMGW
jgi:hypothetical protein